MSRRPEYTSKLEAMEGRTLLAALQPSVRDFVRRLAERYTLTFQELRQVSQAARDLEMWRERPLPDWWQEAELQIEVRGRSRKKALLSRLRGHIRALAAEEKSYPAEGLAFPPRRRMKLAECSSSRQIVGVCPAYSDRTVCCGLLTLDAVLGCAFSCSYCTIQTFYPDTAELEADLPGKLAEIDLDPECRYHIGTGQASDSLAWGNRAGHLDALLDFAATHSNVLLELKTKSDNVGALLERQVPSNVVCSWSLNTNTVIRNEEHGTAPLSSRLAAARSVADHGTRVAFHFHPMLYYEGWKVDYRTIGSLLLAAFRPREVAFVSMGSVTLIKPVIRQIRQRGGATKILQMEMVSDPHGKLTYPDQLKRALYLAIYSSLQPWHDDVFFYLCMESAAIWQDVLGRTYPTNDAFAIDFLSRCLPSRHAPSAPAAAC